MLKIYVVLDPNNANGNLRVRAFVNLSDASAAYRGLESGSTIVEVPLDGVEPGIRIKHQVVTGGVGIKL